MKHLKVSNIFCNSNKKKGLYNGETADDIAKRKEKIIRSQIKF